MPLRERLFARRMKRAIHPERFAAFGERSAIVPPAVVRSPHRIRVGRNVLIHDRAWLSVVEEFQDQRFEPSLIIGDRSVFGRDLYVSCVGRIEIGADVLVSERVLIADTYHGYEDPTTPISRQPMADPEPVKIEDGALLSANVCVLGGVTIGARAYIGAGAVVTRSVPPNCVVVGNPARIVRHYDHEAGRWVDGAPPGWDARADGV